MLINMRNGLMAGGGVKTKTPYILANGGSYISTGIMAGDDLEFDISFLPLIGHSYNCPLGGAGVNWGNSELTLSAVNFGAGYQLKWGSSAAFFMPAGFGPDGFITFSKTGASATVRGIAIQSVSYNGTGISTPFDVAIAAAHFANSFHYRFYGYIFFVNIRKSGETVLSMRPMVQNGVAGMWDSVTNQFFASETSTPFEYGEM